uniref:C-type lectin domain-containing protein n=1 Tax=Neogobius melanostomus TaxID=47308 RepID=A0A8C6WH02_9GOBI
MFTFLSNSAAPPGQDDDNHTGVGEFCQTSLELHLFSSPALFHCTNVLFVLGVNGVHDDDGEHVGSLSFPLRINQILLYGLILVEESTECWQTFDDRSFTFIQSAITWAQAQQLCVALGGNLATIHNQQEEQFVKGVAEGRDAWIGFSDAQEVRDGVWLWINGEPVTFTGWCDGEPNNLHGPQQCAVINYSAKKCWDDAHCLIKRPFVCEKELCV